MEFLDCRPAYDFESLVAGHNAQSKNSKIGVFGLPNVCQIRRVIERHHCPIPKSKNSKTYIGLGFLDCRPACDFESWLLGCKLKSNNSKTIVVLEFLDFRPWFVGPYLMTLTIATSHSGSSALSRAMLGRTFLHTCAPDPCSWANHPCISQI